MLDDLMDYFPRAPRSKRRKLHDDKSKLKEADLMEARLQTDLETFFQQEDMVNFDVIQHHKLTKVYPTTAPTDAEQARAYREEVLPPDIEEVYDPHPEVSV